MSFNIEQALAAANYVANDSLSEKGLTESFASICNFLADNPNIPLPKNASLTSIDGLENLANQYFKGYRRSDFPATPSTVPDEIVSIVMQEAYGYNQEQCDKIKMEHQHSMCAENCVGALLERYLDSILRPYGWHWCCGSIVRAVDFLKKDSKGNWLILQIKNRNNSENSSSSAIRQGTEIQKWFRTFSKTGKTNWHNLPPLMQGYGMNEESFVEFVKNYLQSEKSNSQNKLP